MYSKYSIEISNSFYNRELNRHLETGKKIYQKHEEMAKKSCTTIKLWKIKAFLISLVL